MNAVPNKSLGDKPRVQTEVNEVSNQPLGDKSAAQTEVNALFNQLVDNHIGRRSKREACILSSHY